jgi:hypothetical protein
VAEAEPFDNRAGIVARILSPLESSLHASA